MRLSFDAPFDDLALGESVCISGACLTVVEAHPRGFEVDVTVETLDKTTLGRLSPGDAVNLERAVRAGDRIGGHFVTGHVDGIAEVLHTERAGDAVNVRLGAEPSLVRYVAAKGSVALDGVSLTVNTVDSAAFSLMLIPHTLAVTTLGLLRPGDSANIEADMLAKHLSKLAAASRP
jgi:riboflavin synthase